MGENSRDIPKKHFNFPEFLMILVIEMPITKKSQDFKFEQKTVSYIFRNPWTGALLKPKLKTYGIMNFWKKKTPPLEIISLNCEISLGRGQLHYYGSDIY